MDPAIAKELAALRREIEALRAAGAAAAADPAAPPDAAAEADGLGELAEILQSALKDVERGVAAHPIAGISVAFLAGLLIGRATKPR
ncbi:MAG: hypothetical protein JO107_08660 [Hyphomicrobiales bacterium]|nr:hypothetical protein [Hyphomicrobiales bacterium]